jgi:hypothetical protein
VDICHDAIPFQPSGRSLKRFPGCEPPLALTSSGGIAPDAAVPRKLCGHDRATQFRGEDMTFVMVDTEADGPIAGDYSMVSFGAVIVEPGLARSFYGQLKPISEAWIPDALAVSGHTREETLAFDEPKVVMAQFADWLKQNVKRRPQFISDNNGFDWQFINWYFHHFLGDNPFGHSSSNLGSLYKGVVKDVFQNFKHLRRTEHTHHPVDDAKGNAEAMLHMKQVLGLKFSY